MRTADDAAERAGDTGEHGPRDLGAGRVSEDFNILVLEKSIISYEFNQIIISFPLELI